MILVIQITPTLMQISTGIRFITLHLTLEIRWTVIGSVTYHLTQQHCFSTTVLSGKLNSEWAVII